MPLKSIIDKLVINFLVLTIKVAKFHDFYTFK